MSKHLLWDIDDADLYYTFSKSELQDVNMIEMINLDVRGGNSEYTLPLDMEVGKTITIYNRAFGLTNTGNYYGVKYYLKKEHDSENSSYWFLFKDQCATFFFNGSEWINDKNKRDLFNNIDMSNLQEGLDGCFFKHGNIEDFGTIKEDVFIAHNHTTKPHTHEYQVNTEHKIDNLATMEQILELLDKKDDIGWWLGLTFTHPSLAWWGSDLTGQCGGNKTADEADELSLLSHGTKEARAFYGYGNIQPTGGEESRPKNIQGSFVIQAY